DEIVAEVPDGFGSVEEFRKIMITLPAWAEGLPIDAKVRNGQRFCKIEAPRAAEPAPARQSPASSTPELEILEQFEQTPPHEEEPMREQQQEHARGNGRYEYPHGEEERGRATTTFVYRSADGTPYLQVRKFESINSDGKRKKSYPQYHQEN